MQFPDGHVGAQVVDAAPSQHALERRGLSTGAAAHLAYGEGSRRGHPWESRRGSWTSHRCPVHPRGCTARCDELSHGLGRQIAAGIVPQLPASPRRG